MLLRIFILNNSKQFHETIFYFCQGNNYIYDICDTYADLGYLYDSHLKLDYNNEHTLKILDRNKKTLIFHQHM